MALVTQQVAAQFQKQGAVLPTYQAPVPVPSKGEALEPGQTCPWYKTGVYTDATGALYELPIGCELNTGLIFGIAIGIGLAVWLLMGRKK